MLIDRVSGQPIASSKFRMTTGPAAGAALQRRYRSIALKAGEAS
jgi:hypothetical protein